MRAPGLAEGSTVTGDGAARGRSSTWRRMVAYAAPVVVIALYGALWIGLHAGGGRGSTHTFFQSLALAETVVALLLRRRKPVGALAGILAVYLVFALDPLLLPAVLFALLTVAMERDLRTAALAAAATAAAIGSCPAWPRSGLRSPPGPTCGSDAPRAHQNEVSAGTAGSHGEYDRAAEEVSCLRPRVQLGPPLTGPLIGQDALVCQACHVIAQNSPEELRAAKVHSRRDGHVGQSGGPKQARRLPPDAALDHGAGERVEDDLGRLGVGVIDERRFLVEFEHPNPSARPGHPGHLLNDAGRVWHVLQDGGHPADVKCLVRIGQVSGVTGPQRNPRAQTGGALTGLGDHRLADIDTRYVSIVRHEPRHLGHVDAGTAADVQGGARFPEVELLQ